MSYKERELTVSFTLANGTFDGDIGDTLKVKVSSVRRLYQHLAALPERFLNLASGDFPWKTCQS